MTAILPKELLTATLGGLSLLVVSGGSDGDVLVQQSDGTYAPETLVTGDVFGPASSTDNAIARFDATTGKLLQNCVVTIGDTGNIAGLGTVSCGAITASGIIISESGGITSLESSSNTIKINASGSNKAIDLWATNGIAYVIGGSTKLQANATSLRPWYGTAYDLGDGSDANYRWRDLWLTRNATIGGTITASSFIRSGDYLSIGLTGVNAIYADFQGRIHVINTGFFGIGSGDAAGSAADVVLGRDSANVWGMYTSSAMSSFAGLKAGTITASGLVCMSIYTVATLPSASANAYKEANVSDALAPAMGVAVVGGGSVKTKVRSNGTDWTVCGI